MAAASDVARLAGVSQSAVSRAFTEGASISAKTRQRVMVAAEQLGYRPNQLARSLLKGRSNIVGVVLGNLQNPFFAEVLDALSQSLSAAGQRLLVFTTAANAEVDAQINDLLHYRVDALILMSTTLSSSLARQCQAAGIPVIFVNRTGQVKQCWSVTGDNEGGARQIARHLIEQGYQRLAFMAGFADSSTSCERQRGFCDELARLQQPAPQLVCGEFSREGAINAARQLLQQAVPPDGIFCANDHMALATLDVARHEFGLTPGKDIGVVGFDDIQAASWPAYQLTTFTQPIGPMVKRATECVLQGESRSGETSAVRQQLIAGELIRRNSTSRKPVATVATN